jgi:hypothetical protein
VNYTTLSYGDVTPVERWRQLGPMTAMNGTFEPDQRERALGSMSDSLPATVWLGKAVWRPLILGCGAKEMPPCHGARWRRAILDTMTVQDLRLDIGKMAPQ